MFWLKMAFGSNCGEKKLEFFHQKSALPMIFFKILQKARISRIFQIRTARWGQINYKKKVHPKFLQNLLFHIPIDMFCGKKKISAIESATVNFF